MNEQKNELIRQQLQKLAERVGPKSTVLGTVKSVDEAEGTCVLDDDGILYQDIRLHAVLNGSEGQSVKPKVGAYAVAARIEGGEDFYLIAASELDKWRLTIAEAVLEQRASGLIVKNGNDTLRDALLAIIEAVEVIVVIQGTNPNYTKLVQAKTKILNILSNAT